MTLKAPILTWEPFDVRKAYKAFIKGAEFDIIPYGLIKYISYEKTASQSEKTL